MIAVVNDAAILRSELDARVSALVTPATTATQARELRDATLSEMIDEELIVQAALAARIEVTADEVDAAIVDIKSFNNLDTAGFELALESQGYTIDEYKRALGRQLLRLRAVNQLVAPRIDVQDRQARRKALDQETARWVKRLRAQAVIERKL